MDIPDAQAHIEEYYGTHDAHYFPKKLLQSKHVRELPLRWRMRFLVWVQANTRHSTQHKLQQKKAHALGAEREKVNEFDLVSDISKLVFDGKLKLVSKLGEYELDKSSKQVLISLKRAKLPSGQLKWEKFRKIYPDAECETLARIIPEKTKDDNKSTCEFKVLQFTDAYHDVVDTFKAQFDDSSLARYKFLVIVG